MRYPRSVEIAETSTEPHRRRTWTARASPTTATMVSATMTVAARLWPRAAGFPRQDQREDGGLDEDLKDDHDLDQVPGDEQPVASDAE
jgi:hypothetical protein